MFKFNNKNTRTSLNLFQCLFHQLCTYSTSFPKVTNNGKCLLESRQSQLTSISKRLSRRNSINSHCFLQRIVLKPSCLLIISFKKTLYISKYRNHHFSPTKPNASKKLNLILNIFLVFRALCKGFSRNLLKFFISDLNLLQQCA